MHEGGEDIFDRMNGLWSRSELPRRTASYPVNPVILSVSRPSSKLRALRVLRGENQIAFICWACRWLSTISFLPTLSPSWGEHPIAPAPFLLYCGHNPVKCVNALELKTRTVHSDEAPGAPPESTRSARLRMKLKPLLMVKALVALVSMALKSFYTKSAPIGYEDEKGFHRGEE
jgi:hypothetical protein